MPFDCKKTLAVLVRTESGSQKVCTPPRRTEVVCLHSLCLLTDFKLHSEALELRSERMYSMFLSNFYFAGTAFPWALKDRLMPATTRGLDQSLRKDF